MGYSALLKGIIQPFELGHIQSKRIEYKEATLRFGRRRLLIFKVFLGLHRKREGEEGDTEVEITKKKKSIG